MDYDLEIDKLIDFLFPEGVHEQYEDNQDFVGYLNKLGSLKVDQFHKERKTLEDEKSSIDNQTKHLALTNYKTFVQTADCSRNIYKKICSVEDNVHAFLEETPKLLDECEKFVDISSEIKERRRRNNLILSNSGEILKILEIPQFMNTCIRNELYEEALLLPAFVKRLASKHGDIPLINNIAKDVEKSWWDLMRHLLRQLTTDISLPKCLQIIGFLRRMNIFSEVELRLKFLQARGLWLDALLDAISCENRNQHLSAVIDVTRVNVFSIATQYKAIFTDDEIVVRQHDLKNLLFHSWLNKRINDFLTTVEADLPHCPPNSLDSLLEQCMYFGQSFGRIGADFRGLVVRIFVSTVERNFESAIRTASEQFEVNMKKFVLPKMNSMSNIKNLRHEVDAQSEAQTLNPPSCLLEFLPLAEYCNAVLSSFNDLRYCNLLICLPTIIFALQTSLENVSTILSLYNQKENITWLDREKEIFLTLCSCYSEKFIPFIQQCLFALFEPQNISKSYRVTISELENEGLCYLNIGKVKKSLAGIS